MRENRTPRRQFLGLSFATMLAVVVCPADRCRRPVRTDADIDRDNNITLEVRRALTDDPAVNAMNITVLTLKLEVTLSGVVATAEEKEAAKRIALEAARRIAGAAANQVSVADTKLLVQPPL